MTAVENVRALAEQLPERRGVVWIGDELAAALLADRAAAAAQAAEVQRLLDHRHITAAAVQTELGPAVLIRDVDRILGGTP